MKIPSFNETRDIEHWILNQSSACQPNEKVPLENLVLISVAIMALLVARLRKRFRDSQTILNHMDLEPNDGRNMDPAPNR